MIPSIDTNAPVQVSTSIFINAAPAVVWKILTAVSDWPVWVEAIDAARTDGPVVPGSVIYWAVGEMQITSVVSHVVPGRQLAWRGDDGNTVGVHIWDLAEQDGGTMLVNSESFDGELARNDPETWRAKLLHMLERWNQLLKQRAEASSETE